MFFLIMSILNSIIMVIQIWFSLTVPFDVMNWLFCIFWFVSAAFNFGMYEEWQL